MGRRSVQICQRSSAKVCIFLNDLLNPMHERIYLSNFRAISAYLPRTNDCKLNPHVYEMVLYEYLKNDAAGFLGLIKEWQPSLYNTSAVINAIHNHFNQEDKNILLESLAILYSYEKKYEKALAMYLK